ncbi:hypothetical protein CBE37_02310 [bacterium TMED277]|nr:MAG: hypothetical protein CBE37_04210 [bacterium TMED277]OUX43375.1 MAG: hypothetical protein CBE37_02310 [bacterium TMED277]|tara:strand:+ start:2619 stop:2861 length:243 start_codon:yes stop_codon:yes gene_type:complete
MTKNMMLKALSEYMQENNVDTVSLSDYKADPKAPVRDYLLRRKFGSWNRVLAAAKFRFPIEIAAPAPAPAPKKAKAKKED